MSAGRVWPAECTDYADPLSGARVRRLTNYKAHSHHLYFTNPGWHAGGRRLLVASERQNCSNLYSIDLQSGELLQLTDLPADAVLRKGCVNPVREEAYLMAGRDLWAVDLETLEQHALFERPEGFRDSMVNCTADGAHVCMGLYEDLSDRIRLDLGRGYVGFRENWEAHPLSRIYRVATDGGGAEMVWEEKTWIGHVNTSPTQAHLLTFCHEGPWELVDNRIWGMDLRSGGVWKIRPREDAEILGHEYWYADGVHIGYHGAWPDGRKLFGHIRYDDTGRVEVGFPFETGHTHSNDHRLIAGDAGSVVRLWRWNGEGYDGPRVLCEHRCSKHIQNLHVHPRFSPDGTEVLFTSDKSGYGNVYLVEVPEFGSLPLLEEATGGEL